MANIRTMLDEELVRELEELKQMETGSAKKEAAICNIRVLHELRKDEYSRIEDYVRIGVDGAGMLLQIGVYVVLYHKGLNFEVTGAPTSFFFKDLIRRMKLAGK